VRGRLLAASLLAWAVDTEADWRLSVVAGPSCDAPAVEDGAPFDSRCSVQPLLGAPASFSGPGRWRFETEATYSDGQVYAAWSDYRIPGDGEIYVGRARFAPPP
jgi:hypothetical protein